MILFLHFLIKVVDIDPYYICYDSSLYFFCIKTLIYEIVEPNVHVLTRMSDYREKEHIIDCI